MYVCVYIYIYICMYICVYIYIYIYVLSEGTTWPMLMYMHTRGHLLHWMLAVSACDVVVGNFPSATYFPYFSPVPHGFHSVPLSHQVMTHFLDMALRKQPADGS